MDRNNKVGKSEYLRMLIMHELIHHLGIRHDDSFDCNLMCQDFLYLTSHEFDPYVIRELNRLGLLQKP